jgi:2-methylisocitrate lyase-like PEP mutase family enzyme
MTHSNGTPQTPGTRLRALLNTGQLLIAPGVFDGISAHLVRQMDFKAAYLTGAGTAASGFGLPDIGLVTGSEMAERAGMIKDAVGDLPLIADADTGYGAPINVVRTVRAYEKAGVAAIQLEDQTFPKRCGHLPDKEVISQAEFCAKLGAALDARTDALIVARTDARAVLGLDAAITRANAYAEAGADIIFVEAPRTAAEIEQIAREVDAPLLINLVTGGLTPDATPEDLQDLGYAIAIRPVDLFAAAAHAMIAALRELGGTLPGEPGRSPKALFEMVGLADWQAIGDAFPVPAAAPPASSTAHTPAELTDISVAAAGVSAALSQNLEQKG